jgi:hypothetical protein
MSGGKRTRWTPEVIALLGTVSDVELAARLGIHFVTVAKVRYRHGIKPHQPQQKWTAEHVAMLGQMPDAEVARRTGRSKWAVTAARRKRGIHGVPVAYPPKA